MERGTGGFNSSLMGQGVGGAKGKTEVNPWSETAS